MEGEHYLITISLKGLTMDLFSDINVDDDPHDLNDLDDGELEEPLNLDAEDWQDFDYDSKDNQGSYFFDDLSKVDLDQLPF